MVSVTHARWQAASIPTRRGPTVPAAAGAVEIRLATDIPNADPALYRILVLPPGLATAEPPVDRLQAASDSGGDEPVNQWSQLGPPDGEPTWEDAAWQ